MDRRIFGKEEVGAVERQVTVDFVGRDLVKAWDIKLAAKVHKVLSTADISVDKDVGCLNRTVDMRLGSEVDDDVGFYFFEELFYSLTVADVELFETKVGIF